MEYLILYKPKNLMPFKFFSLNDIKEGSIQQKQLINTLCERWEIASSWEEKVKGCTDYAVYEGRGEGRDYLALIEDTKPNRKREFPDAEPEARH